MQIPAKSDALLLLKSLQSREPAGLSVIPSKEVILYGAGNLGKLAAQFLQYVGVKVKFAIDKKANPHMLEEFGIPTVTSIEAGSNADKLLLVSTLSEPYSAIATELKNLGWKNVFPFYDYAQHYKHKHPLNNGWFCGQLTPEDITGISHVMETLEDDHSLGAYLQFIAWRLLREDWTYEDAPVIPENRYLIPQISQALSNHENFLDIGAYDGRVLLNLLKRTDYEVNSAVMIEPDTVNVELLKKTLRTLPQNLQNKIKLLPLVVSDRSGFTSFSQGFDFASRECDITPSKFQSVTIDDLALSPTFIKIHTEGTELAVLNGGRKTMIIGRPKIAVTVYHGRDGLWKIPAYLISLLDEYTFYLRVHSWCGTGTVFYAIPSEQKVN